LFSKFITKLLLAFYLLLYIPLSGADLNKLQYSESLHKQTN